MILRAGLAVAVVSTAVVAPPQNPPFSAKVEMVRVDVLVTDRGQPVRGLKDADFELLDNDVLQQMMERLRNMTPEQKMMLKTALESLGCYRSASYTPGESHASVEEDLETEVAGMVVKANRLRKQVEAKIKNRRGK